MLPRHCKDVSIKNVDFQLTKANIDKAIVGKKAYTRCDHYILRHEKDLAIVQVEKEEGQELFRPIIKHNIIAFPKDIILVKDPSVDVINLSVMARISKDHPGKYVVVEGMFDHVSFVSDAGTIELRVFDIVPPRPSKLSVLVERALASGIVDLPIVPVYEELDINELTYKVHSSTVMFPCRSSGIISDKPTYYLDELPELPKDVTLIGCDLSSRIFSSYYGMLPQRIDLCPRTLAPKDDRKRLIRCCKIKEGYEIKGSTAMVPWGANVRDVSEGISALFEGTSSAL